MDVSTSPPKTYTLVVSIVCRTYTSGEKSEERPNFKIRRKNKEEKNSDLSFCHIVVGFYMAERER